MRSFFALVEQVSPYCAIKPHLAPFKELLKKNCKFYWDNNLEKLFRETRSEKADKILDSLTRFEVNRETGLTTDWSKAGVGFMLSQKHCDCSDITPSCCVGGWRTCMVGSRFTNKAESNYAPIEGELLAVTYGLKKTRYYTLRSEKLTVCVDHKPLLGVLGETELEKIDNTRLEELKEKNIRVEIQSRPRPWEIHAWHGCPLTSTIFCRPTDDTTF